MRTRRSSPSTLARKSLELSLAAPQVVAHRLSRMATAGANPSARDRQEFWNMGAEKVVAFQQSWLGMASTLAQAQWRAAASMWLLRPPASPLAEAGRVASRVLSAGLTPIHAKAVANARRLSRRR